LIKSGELDVDGAMHLIVEHTRKAANTTGVAMGPLFGTRLPLPGLEEGDRRSGTCLSQLASTLSEHSAVSADTALDVALHDIAEQARLATKAGAAAISW
jgi:hypothetical protein